MCVFLIFCTLCTIYIINNNNNNNNNVYSGTGCIVNVFLFDFDYQHRLCSTFRPCLLWPNSRPSEPLLHTFKNTLQQNCVQRATVSFHYHKPQNLWHKSQLLRYAYFSKILYNFRAPQWCTAPVFCWLFHCLIGLEVGQNVRFFATADLTTLLEAILTVQSPFAYIPSSFVLNWLNSARSHELILFEVTFIQVFMSIKLHFSIGPLRMGSLFL